MFFDAIPTQKQTPPSLAAIIRVNWGGGLLMQMSWRFEGGYPLDLCMFTAFFILKFILWHAVLCSGFCVVTPLA